MKTRVVFLLPFLLFFPGIQSFLSGESIFNYPLNSRTEPEQALVFKALASHNLVKSDFEQIKTISRLGKHFSSEGVFLIYEGKGLAWLYEKPFVSRLVITDRQMFQSGSDGKLQKVMADSSEVFAGFSRMVQSVFSGNQEKIKRDYEVFFQKKEDGRWRIGLIPRDSFLGRVVKNFELEGGDYVDSFLIREAGGDEVLYKFLNTEFPDSAGDPVFHVFP